MKSKINARIVRSDFASNKYKGYRHKSTRHMRMKFSHKAARIYEYVGTLSSNDFIIKRKLLSRKQNYVGLRKRVIARG